MPPTFATTAALTLVLLIFPAIDAQSTGNDDESLTTCQLVGVWPICTSASSSAKLGIEVEKDGQVQFTIPTVLLKVWSILKWPLLCVSIAALIVFLACCRCSCTCCSAIRPGYRRCNKHRRCGAIKWKNNNSTTPESPQAQQTVPSAPPSSAPPKPPSSTAENQGSPPPYYPPARGSVPPMELLSDKIGLANNGSTEPYERRSIFASSSSSSQNRPILYPILLNSDQSTTASNGVTPYPVEHLILVRRRGGEMGSSAAPTGFLNIYQQSQRRPNSVEHHASQMVYEARRLTSSVLRWGADQMRPRSRENGQAMMMASNFGRAKQLPPLERF